MKLEFKKDPWLLGFAAVLVVVFGALMVTKTITPKEGLLFLGGALALPGLFGAAKKEDDDDAL